MSWCPPLLVNLEEKNSPPQGGSSRCIPVHHPRSFLSLSPKFRLSHLSRHVSRRSWDAAIFLIIPSVAKFGPRTANSLQVRILVRRPRRRFKLASCGTCPEPCGTVENCDDRYCRISPRSRGQKSSFHLIKPS